MKNQTIIQPASRLDSIQEYYFSKKLREIANMRSAGKDILNLGIGSPDLPPDEAVIEELNDHSLLPNTHSYQGYYGLPELRHAFAEWYDRFFDVSLNPENEVLPLIGSKEGIVHIAMTFLQEGDTALVPNPGYPAYAAATKLAGAEVIEFKLAAENNWLPDLDALEKEDLSRVKVLWINYPNMPTGARANRSLFQRLIAFGKKHNILIVNDNPYSFILNNQYLSLLSVPGAKSVALELNSLSKSHNMAGWRTGVLVGEAALINLVLRFKSNMDSGMFKPVQLAAVHALQLPEEWYDNLNKVYQQRRKKVYEVLSLLGCTWNENASGMFVWAKIPSSYKDSYEMADKILHHAHVFITPGGIFGSQGDQYIRASLCSKEEVFDEAVRRIVASGLKTHDTNGYAPANARVHAFTNSPT